MSQQKHPILRDQLIHGVMALLMGAGLYLPLLSLFSLPNSYILPGLGVIAGICLLRTVCGLHRIGKWAAEGILAAGALIWSLSGGGILLTRLGLAVRLFLYGEQTTLFLYAVPFSLILAAIVGWIVWILCIRGAGGYMGLAVVLLFAAGLWLAGRENALPGLLPALISAVTVTVLTRHEAASARRVLPAIALMMAVAFLLTPKGGITVPAMHDAAENLRQLIMDYFFYTEPRDVFTLATDGYYPQGVGQLGGPAQPSDRTVMQVSAPRTVYLRGVARNEYTGRGWRDTTGGRRYLYGSPAWSSHRDKVLNMSLPSGALGTDSTLLTEQSVTVQLLDDCATSLFVPQRVRQIQAGGDLVLYFNNTGEIFATRNLAAGDSYTVSAPLAVAGDPGLGTIIEACAANPDPDYQEVLALYTQLPDHLQSMVYGLATDITADAATPYEKAMALQVYLSGNYRYSLDVAPQPEDIDFVTNFLFNTQTGYCTYFASAMTVMCRMVGLPARYVEGYLVQPDENGHAVITGKDGHAWTEIYFPGFGWLTFDATPSDDRQSPPDSRSDPPRNDPPPQDTPTPTPPPADDDAPTPTPPPPDQDDDLPTPEPPEDDPSSTPPDDEPPHPDDNPNQDDDRDPPDLSWLWWVLLILALAAGVTIRVLYCTPERAQKRCNDPVEVFVLWTQAVFDALTVRHLPRRTGESPKACLTRLDGVLHAGLSGLGTELNRLHYGKLPCTEEQIETARMACGILLQTLTPTEKLRWYLRRAFLPLSRRDYTKG